MSVFNADLTSNVATADVLSLPFLI